LIGQSGVGKSSLFQALGGDADVGDVSKTGRGKQTTTAGRLHRFAAGFLIDSPGVGEFELRDLSAAEIARGFVEFAPLLGSCRFSDCVHRSEPGCAVLAAVAAGTIAGSRYDSYRAILER
jgi:ribosome biogenesis GTPase